LIDILILKLVFVIIGNSLQRGVSVFPDSVHAVPYLYSNGIVVVGYF